MVCPPGGKIDFLVAGAGTGKNGCSLSSGYCEPEGLAHWTAQFGSEVDPEERAVFERAAAPELKINEMKGSATDDAKNIYEQIKKLDISLLGEKIKPPQGY